MPAEVICHVNYIARDEKAHPGIAFLDRTYNLFPDDLYADDPDDESWQPENNNNDDDDDYDDELSFDDQQLAGVNNDYDENADDEDNPNPIIQIHDDNNNPITPIIPNNNNNVIPIINPIHVEIQNQQYNNNHAFEGNANNNQILPFDDVDANQNQPFDEVNDNADEENNEVDGNANEENENNVNIEMAQEIKELEQEIHEREELRNRLHQAMDDRYGARTGRYNLRAQRPRDYGHHLHTMMSSAMFTQYNVKKGIMKFKEKGIHAVQSELKQLHDREVIIPRSPGELTKEQ